MEKVKTLIVEDEIFVARDLQMHLEQMGYTVASMVPSGEQAIQKIENEIPDIVLMDIVLQEGMDGIETAEVIHSRFDVPVIFLTAHDDKAIFERAKKTGPFGYIIKPFQGEDLRKVIEIALFRHKAKQERKALRKEIAERKRAENALRESEEKYRKLIETAQDAIVCDENGKITIWNRSAERIFGYSKEEITGQPVTTVVPERYNENNHMGMEQFPKSGKIEIMDKTVELSGITKEGVRFPIEMSLSCQKAGVEGYTFTSIIRDITFQKKAKEQLIEKSREIEKVNKELKSFVYNVYVAFASVCD